MKKAITVLLIALFVFNCLKAQTSDTLTNAVIVKMVKAKLSDDLIIDEISSSKANFNLSKDSIKFLTTLNVSSPVIEAMKAAENSNADVAPAKPVASGQPLLSRQAGDAIVPVHDTIKQVAKETLPNNTSPAQELPDVTKVSDGDEIPIDRSTLKNKVISYVIPVKDLVTFYNAQLASFSGFIQQWNQRIKDSLEKEKQTKQIITRDEQALYDKENADAKVFSNEILMLKDKLSKERDEYKRLRIDIVNDGKSLSDALEELRKETDRRLNDQFNETSKAVKRSHPDPSVAGAQQEISTTVQKFDPDLVIQVVPLNVILACYKNEIIFILDTIPFWNEKALTLIQQDSKLAMQLSPLNKELSQYLSAPKYNRKLNKKEIASLKKQCGKLNDDRGQLADQIVDDSKKLSECLDQIQEEASAAIKERFIDAINNINNSYEDNL